MSSRYITVMGVADLLGVSRRRAYQLVATDKFPPAVPVDTGSENRPVLIFDRSKVVKWKERNRV